MLRALRPWFISVFASKATRVCACTLLSVGCRSATHATKPSADPPQQTAADIAASDLRTTQASLLDDAMRAASSLETPAHRKIRTRLQRDTAVAALDLSMLDLGTRMAGRIDDWRRGEVLAIAAQAFARAGDPDAARNCLETAIGTVPSSDGWMRERLITEIGVAYAVLGEVDEARRYGALVPTELTGRVETALASRVTTEEIDRQCDAFDQAIATRSLDVVRSGVDGYFAVLQRLSDDPSRRARAETAIRATLAELPPELRLEATIRLAVAVGAAGRLDDARRDLADAERQFRSLNLAPDTSGPLARDLAIGFVKVGDAAHARALLLELLGAYERSPKDFVDIERADYLRAIAEALRQAGDPAGAARTWMLALDAGAENPNGRPRAEDLCLTCISLARAGESPSAEMRRRIADIQAGLKAPW